jgi:hypothetical protein
LVSSCQLDSNRALDQGLSRLNVSTARRQSVDRQRARLAGTQVDDLPLRKVIDEASVSGFHEVIWISIAMALLSGLTAEIIRSSKPSLAPLGELRYATNEALDVMRQLHSESKLQSWTAGAVMVLVGVASA